MTTPISVAYCDTYDPATGRCTHDSHNRPDPTRQGADASLISTDPVEHARHAALGENRWFSCGLCDERGSD